MGTPQPPEWPTGEAYQQRPDRCRTGGGEANFMPDSRPLGEEGEEPTGMPATLPKDPEEQEDSLTDEEKE